MSNAQPEPSMEEILASIRRIISEEDDDVTPPAAGASAPAPRSAPAALTSPPRAIHEEPRSGGPEARPEPKEEAESVEMFRKNVVESVQDEEDVILDEAAAAAASRAFQSLSQSVRVSSPEGAGRTLEDIVTDLLKPMIKDWLDANLASIVEEKVEEEVQRLARRRR